MYCRFCNIDLKGEYLRNVFCGMTANPKCTIMLIKLCLVLPKK